MPQYNAVIDLSALTGSTGAEPGFVINGIDAGDRSGFSIASAGDVNGDGFDDILIGARGGDPAGDNDAGETYVVFGKAGGFGASLDLGSLDGTNGFRLDGIDPNDISGFSVASAGDLNGDGFDDIIIGALGGDPAGDNDAGESYVVFGKAGGFGASLDLSTLDGTNGFRLDGIDAGDNSGWSVASAGDVNSDGFDDILIGGWGGDPGDDGNAGESYVVFGKAGGFGASLDLATLDGTNGFRLDGIDADDQSGFCVASAGDVNGDGFDDILIGAYGGDPGSKSFAGESYVVLGRKPDSAVTRTGTNASQTLAGGDFNDVLSGLGGNDILFGHGGDDILDGGAGTNILRGGTGNDTYVLGGSTTNTIIETSGIDTITSTVTRNLASLVGIENATLLGNANASLTGNGGANTLTGNSGRNTLKGEAGNDVLFGGRQKDVYTGGSGRDDFDFNSISDAGKGSQSDRITDFRHLQDDIDLRDIDANVTLRGDQAFKFIGQKEFTGKAGELRFEKINKPGTARDDTIVEGDINGDGRADFQIELDGLINLTKVDFFL